MAKRIKEPSDLRIDVKAKRIWVQSLQAPIGSDDGIWVWDCEDKIESHCPMDRVGGPYGLSDFVNEDNEDKFFIFCVVDSYFPIYDLVCARSFEQAYEDYVDFAADNRHCLINDTDLKDYLDKNGEYQGSYTSDGKPVDTEAIQGNEVRLIRIDV